MIGVLLAMAGLYGVLAFEVTQRMSEFGVRIALGARTADILRLVLQQGLTLVGIGIVIGVGAAVAAGRVVSRFLFGVNPADPITFAIVLLLLVLVAIATSLRGRHWLPGTVSQRLASAGERAGRSDTRSNPGHGV